MVKQRRSGFNPIFIFMLLLLAFITFASSFGKVDERYTKQQLITDLEAKKVVEITVNQNKEVPTGYLMIELTGGHLKKLYVTDIKAAETLVREYGFDPLVTDVPRESWWLSTFLPMLFMLVAGVILFSILSGRAGGGNNGKMMNFGKSNAQMLVGDKTITFEKVAGLNEEKEEQEWL